MSEIATAAWELGVKFLNIDWSKQGVEWVILLLHWMKGILLIFRRV
jgi:hypothetical protein